MSFSLAIAVFTLVSDLRDYVADNRKTFPAEIFSLSSLSSQAQMQTVFTFNLGPNGGHMWSTVSIKWSRQWTVILASPTYLPSPQTSRVTSILLLYRAYPHSLVSSSHGSGISNVPAIITYIKCCFRPASLSFLPSLVAFFTTCF